MMNDSVREEVISKGNLRSSGNGSLADRMLMPDVDFATIAAAVAVIAEPPSLSLKPKARTVRTETMEFESKNTSQTLKDFQNKNAAMPDWRIQLQNSVRQRKAGVDRSHGDGISEIKKRTTTSGANALKAEFVEETIEIKHEDPRVAKALQRIEASRQTFLKSQEPKAKLPVQRPARPNYPFDLVSPSTRPDHVEEPLEHKASPIAPSKPNRVSSLRIEKKGFDTNKLPKIPKSVEIVSGFEKPHLIESANVSEAKIHLGNEPRLDEAAMKELDDLHFELENQAPTEKEGENDDLATISMRFGSGVFDMLIAGFASLVFLSPFAFSAESWFTLGSFLAFTFVFCVMMFLYSTAALSRFGKTLGMKLFGIELIDVSENVYPTLKQSAINSAAYIASLIFACLGFVPMLLNRERRALHDLVSGTIVVREL